MVNFQTKMQNSSVFGKALEWKILVPLGPFGFSSLVVICFILWQFGFYCHCCYFPHFCVCIISQKYITPEFNYTHTCSLEDSQRNLQGGLWINWILGIWNQYQDEATLLYLHLKRICHVTRNHFCHKVHML
jgi:hypothetical protein